MSSVPSWKEIPKYPVISGMALVAIGVTIAWWSGTNISPLFENAEIRRGQLWRLATSIFPHVNFLHLAFNLYWLWVFGTTVERVYGHLRTGLLILFFAHAAGAAFGVLVGCAIVLPNRRLVAGSAAVVLILLGFVGATVARPFVNFSSHGGYEEGKWGYDDLIANRNQEALRWLRDAARYQPSVPSYWFNLGIAYERLNNQSAALSAYQRAYQLQPTDPKYAEAAGKSIGTN